MAADIPGSREVCGDAALFFLPSRRRTCACQLMRRIATEPGLREELIRKGRVKHRARVAVDQSEAILETIAEIAGRAGL